MKIKRVEHVAIAVNDIRSSMAMLENIFGLEMEYEERIGDTELAMYPIGETYLELLRAAGPKSAVADWVEAKGESL